MSLSKTQKGNLKSLRKLDSQARANTNYRTRLKLKNELDGLEDIETMLSYLPRDHAEKAVNDKHVAKVMKILLTLLDLRGFKRVRQEAPGDEGYVIKKSRARAPLTQKDYNRYIGMWHFAVNFKKYFNPRVVLPGDSDLLDVSPRYEINEWVSVDDNIDYRIHQQLHGEVKKDIDVPYFKSEEEWKLHEEEITRKAIQRNIEACNEFARFLKSTH